MIPELGALKKKLDYKAAARAWTTGPGKRSKGSQGREGHVVGSVDEARTSELAGGQISAPDDDSSTRDLNRLGGPPPPRTYGG
jgi:hypothetical protein